MSKLIAVWGSPSSGKTILSAKLAFEISENGMSTILLSTDELTPIIPVLMPGNADKCSVGQVLEATDVISDSILKNSVIPKGTSNLAVLGYANGENELSYVSNTLERSNDLLLHLSHMADYIIVDCSSDFRRNLLTKAALLQAEVVIQLYTAEPRSEIFYAAQRISLDNEKFNYNLFTRVLRLGNNAKMQAVNEMKTAMERIESVIPYSVAVAQQYEAGNLFSTCPDMKYCSAVKSLVKESILSYENS